MINELIAKMAERFCATPLPWSVAADQCATQPGFNRAGTNLLTIAQAAEMLAAVLPASPLLPVVDDKGYITLHAPDEDGKPGDIVFSTWGDDWPAYLAGPPPVATATVVDAGEASGWIVGNDSGTEWRAWKRGFPVWTNDRAQALRYARREDAENAHEEDMEAWRVEPFPATPTPPAGGR